MQHSRFIRALTLFCFLFFISAFLFYRAGGFDRYIISNNASIQTSHNGGAIRTVKPDSLVSIPGDSLQRLLMYSSKSMVLVDKKIQLYDTGKPRIKKIAVPKGPVIMSSSKSSIIFAPPRIDFNLDSIKFDIKKFRKLKN